MPTEIKTNGPSDDIRALARESSNKIHNGNPVNPGSAVRRVLVEGATNNIMGSFDNHYGPSNTEPIYRYNNAGSTYGNAGKRVPSR